MYYAVGEFFENKFKKKNVYFPFPAWWHIHGMKFRVKEYNAKEKRLSLKASATFLTIQPHIRYDKSKDELRQDGWTVIWKVIYSIPSGCYVQGQTWFSYHDLRLAFDPEADINDLFDWYERFSPISAASQGRFIRYKNYLNIPGPGTGHDGDANVSIDLTDPVIVDSVKELLNNTP